MSFVPEHSHLQKSIPPKKLFSTAEIVQPSAAEKIMRVSRFAPARFIFKCQCLLHVQMHRGSTTMRCTHQVRKYASDDSARLISIIMPGMSPVDLPREKFSGLSQMSSRSGDLPSYRFSAAKFYDFNACPQLLLPHTVRHHHRFSLLSSEHPRCAWCTTRRSRKKSE